MNKADFIEFVKIGNIVKMTSNGEKYVCRIDAIMESSVKVTRISTNMAKIIKIDTIDDVDFDIDSDAAPTADIKTTERIVTIPPDYMQGVEEIFKDADIPYEDKTEFIKSELKGSAIISKWNSVYSSFTNAKKNNSVSEKIDKWIRMLDDLAYDYPEFETAIRVQVADILYENGEYQAAYDENDTVKMYRRCVTCAQKMGDKERIAEAASKCIFFNEGCDEDIFRLFFLYTVQTHNAATALWVVDQLSGDMTEMFSAIIADGLTYIALKYNGIGALPAEKPADAAAIKKTAEALEKFTAGETVKKINARSDSYTAYKDTDVSTDSNILTGCITFYDQDKGFGFIDNNIYFYIKQVLDDKLRQKLCRYGSSKEKVRYSKGMGKTGPAADRISPITPIVDYAEESPKIIKGFLTVYNSINEWGKVSDGNKAYGFKLSAVNDIYLNRYLTGEIKIQELEVEFTLRSVGGKVVAENVMFADNEENAAVKSRYSVSEREIENFTSVLRRTNRLRSFAVPDYEQLPPLPLIPPSKTSETSSENTMYSKIELPPVRTVYSTKEPFVPSEFFAFEDENDADNPFLNLPPVSRKGNYYSEGHSSLLNKDDETAEKNFLFAISCKEQLPSAVMDLFGLYLRQERFKECAQLLSAFRHEIGIDKYNNQYVQLLDKSKDYDKLIKGLEIAIPRTYKVNSRLHFIQKLAITYSKVGLYDKSITEFEEWKKTKVANIVQLGIKPGADNYSTIEYSIDKGMAIALYLSGRREEARSIALKLRQKRNDDIILIGILNGTYMQGDAEEFDYDELEYDAFSGSNYGDIIPKYAEQVMKGISLIRAFKRNSAIYKRIDSSTNKYTGTARDADKDIESAISSIRDNSTESKATIWMAIAVIQHQFMSENDLSGLNLRHINGKSLLENIGRSLAVQGDIKATSPTSGDTVRYLYLLALSVIVRRDSYYHYNSFNALTGSLFISSDELKKFSDSNAGKNNYNMKIMNRDCFSVRNLVICSFDLGKIDSNQRNRSLADILLSEIFKHCTLRKQTCEELNRISGKPQTDVPDIYSDFKSLWESARSEYDCFIKELKANIESISKSTRMIDRLRTNKDNLQNLLNRNMMCDTDKKAVSDFVRITDKCIRANELTGFDERESNYRNIISEAVAMFNETNLSPTKVAFEYLRPALEFIQTIFTDALNELYAEGKPVIEVSAEPYTYIGSDNKCRININFSNKGNVQSATISNISVCGSQSNPSVEVIGLPISNVTSVKGNSNEQYIANMAFTDVERQKTYLELDFSFEYSYYTGFNIPETDNLTRTFQINLHGSDDFKEISNPFSSYASGAAVTENKMFKGREKDIGKIIDMLKNETNDYMKHMGIYMFGQTRAGKSSILAHLKEHITASFPDKYFIVDVGSVGNISSNGNFTANFCSTIILKIKLALRTNEYKSYYAAIIEDGGDRYFDTAVAGINSTDNCTIAFGMVFSDILAHLNGMIPLFLIDEFTYIYQYIREGKIDDAFPHFWKAFLQDYDTCAIVVGMEHMKDFVNDIRYTNDFGCMRGYQVSYLSYEGACELIEDPIRNEDGSSKFEPDAVEYIYSLTAGSAYLIMILCDKLVDYMNKTFTERVTRTTVETLVNDMISTSDFSDSFFEPQLVDKSKFGMEQTDINKDNRVVLEFISRYCNTNYEISAEALADKACWERLSEPTEARLKYVVNQLVARNVIEENRGLYKIVVDLLRIWLNK